MPTGRHTQLARHRRRGGREGKAEKRKLFCTLHLALVAAEHCHFHKPSPQSLTPCIHYQHMAPTEQDNRSWTATAEDLPLFSLGAACTTSLAMLLGLAPQKQQLHLHYNTNSHRTRAPNEVWLTAIQKQGNTQNSEQSQTKALELPENRLCCRNDLISKYCISAAKPARN